MTYQLRGYQQDAVNAVIAWVKSSIDPCVVDLPTGGGKSLIIAELSKVLTSISKGRKVLVLQPSKELLEQNSARYQLTGEPFSLFSASVGIKSLDNDVVFATPHSVKGSLDKFDGKFCALIMDECHLLSHTTIRIIDSIKAHNKNLRVIGLSATPFTMNDGLMYKLDEYGNPVPESKANDPYFTKLAYKLSARHLVDNGYLTQPVIEAVGDKYNTSALEVKAGRFTPESVDRAFVGRGRLTSFIVNEIVLKAQGHKTVMIFGSTLAHCREIMESLPADISRMIDGKTPKKEREQAIQDTKDLKIKYLVNCETLTTGVDIESVSIIAILRATLSPVLITQIIGRALRVYPGKEKALILDYTNTNIDYFFPEGDLFSPTIKVAKVKESLGIVPATCEYCGAVNEFAARPNDSCFDIDDNGYFLNLDGHRIMINYQAMPAHYGRRCGGLVLQRNGTHKQCDYFWSYQECPECSEKCDIAARYCPNKHELIDPNTKLVNSFREKKKDPYQLQCDKVVTWACHKTLSKAGNECLKVDFTTEYRSFSMWYQVKSGDDYLIRQYDALIRATNGLQDCPLTLTYKKNAKNDFYKILAYNMPADQEPAP